MITPYNGIVDFKLYFIAAIMNIRDTPLGKGWGCGKSKI